MRRSGQDAYGRCGRSRRARPDRYRSLSRLLRARETGVFLALLALCLFLSFATDGFLTSLNLLNVGRQISLLGIMAVGMTFVLIAGEVDLSVGSTYAFCRPGDRHADHRRLAAGAVARGRPADRCRRSA